MIITDIYIGGPGQHLPLTHCSGQTTLCAKVGQVSQTDDQRPREMGDFC